ncbi:hypothetical protein NDR87_09750 [Nocardia sp. CDC159]|uniref:Uncharacterized protein n=1 Tax=Nocardia pulmonis TaxID=2951408 RepID=A0A9X2IVC7_9NOCA|nr:MULTISPECIES: hypothetical protein [Nocardia]MCM6773752.1 hypothetical protein [Nocardia pulmonis]MCM6786639.1 hypothetical protein [Nocardia sp. CDC159]
MKKSARNVLTIAAACAFTALSPIAAQAAPGEPPAAGESAPPGTPWIKYGVYPTQAVCGQTGHNLVNRDIYADYSCSRELKGWGLWVRK